MYCIMADMKTCGSDGPTTFRAVLVSLRWTDKRRGKWRGNVVRETGDFLALPGDIGYLQEDEIVTEWERCIAARHSRPAQREAFPFR